MSDRDSHGPHDRGRSGASADGVRLPPLSRRGALRLLGAGTLGALGARAVHPLVQVPAGEEWRPRFFDPGQLALVTELAERIVPETETPGARAALVHQYLDWKVSEASPQIQALWVSGLESIEEASRSTHGTGYLELPVEERHALLARLAEEAEADPPEDASGRQLAHAFFRQLKSHTVHGYYRSEAGMRQELGYRGNAYLRRFEGCQHPEHHEWEPVSADQRAPRREE